MIQELHQKKLSLIPPPPIQPAGEYYAVDYVKNYYFGRVLDSAGSFVQIQVPAQSRGNQLSLANVDRVHHSNVFFGPVT